MTDVVDIPVEAHAVLVRVAPDLDDRELSDAVSSAVPVKKGGLRRRVVRMRYTTERHVTLTLAIASGSLGKRYTDSDAQGSTALANHCFDAHDAFRLAAESAT